MKTHITRSLGCTLLTATCLAGGLVTPTTAIAAPPAAITELEDAARLTARVAVPSDGEAVTYETKGAKATVQPGQTATIPADAKNIYLPKGTMFTVTPLMTTYSSKGGLSSAKGGIPSPSAKGGMPSNSYTVNEPVTLADLSPASLKANSDSFTLAGQTGDQRLPSGTMVDLVNEINRLSQSGVNSFELLEGGPGSGITDGN